jgi:hypothetical protein
MFSDWKISSPFKRGLDGEAIKTVRDFLNSTLGKEIISSTCDLGNRYHPFIRNNYVDFYWAGCRLVCLNPRSIKNRYKINAAYMEGPKTKDQKSRDIYLQEREGDLWHGSESFRKRVIDYPETTFGPWLHDGSDDEFDEKQALYNYRCRNRTDVFLDVEAAYSVQKGESRPRAERVDIALLRGTENTLRLVEVKLESNSAIRSNPDRIPKVIAQMKKYEWFLREQRDQIIGSYRNIAQNILDLGLADRFVCDTDRATAENRLTTIAESLELAEQPELLVFGKKSRNENDEAHWQRLCRLMQENGLPCPQLQKAE